MGSFQHTSNLIWPLNSIWHCSLFCFWNTFLASTTSPSPGLSCWLSLLRPLCGLILYFTMKCWNYIFWSVLFFTHWLLTYNYFLEVSTQGSLQFIVPKVKFLIIHPVQTHSSFGVAVLGNGPFPSASSPSYLSSPCSLVLGHPGLLFVLQMNRAVFLERACSFLSAAFPLLPCTARGLIFLNSTQASLHGSWPWHLCAHQVHMPPTPIALRTPFVHVMARSWISFWLLWTITA